MIECIRCGTTQNLISHDFTYDILHLLSKDVLYKWDFKSKIRESLRSIRIQVCWNCKKLFDKWLLIEDVIFFIGTIEFVLSLIWGILFTFSIFWGAPLLSIFGHQINVVISPLTSLIIFSIIFALFLINIIWYLVHKHKDTNPRNYIRIGTGGVPIVRPHNYPAWIDYDDWVSALEPKLVLSDKSKAKENNHNLKFENLIYKFLKSNTGKAYTIKAILIRIVEQLSEATEREYIETNCQKILNNMSLKRMLKVVVEQGEVYYLIT